MTLEVLLYFCRCLGNARYCAPSKHRVQEKASHECDKSAREDRESYVHDQVRCICCRHGFCCGFTESRRRGRMAFQSGGCIGTKTSKQPISSQLGDNARMSSAHAHNSLASSFNIDKMAEHISNANSEVYISKSAEFRTWHSLGEIQRCTDPCLPGA